MQNNQDSNHLDIFMHLHNAIVYQDISTYDSFTI